MESNTKQNRTYEQGAADMARHVSEALTDQHRILWSKMRQALQENDIAAIDRYNAMLMALDEAINRLNIVSGNFIVTGVFE